MAPPLFEPILVYYCCFQLEGTPADHHLQKLNFDHFAVNLPIFLISFGFLYPCSCSEVSLVKEVEASIFSTLHEGHLEELLKEMELLREKNTSMEGELKQMQERYSDISLKFAEVEGERQRLQMTVNRKNRKKS